MAVEQGAPRDGLIVGLAVVLVALLLAGGTAVALAALREHEDAEESQRETSELVRTDVAASVHQVLASLAGTSAVVADENFQVNVDRWRRFASEAAERSVVDSLALEVKVPDSQRAAFEAFTGHPILERDPTTDELVPAATRDVYLPILSVAPPNEDNQRILGFDIASEPVRAAAALVARDNDEVVISDPVTSQVTGTPSFFVIKPLYALNAPTDTPTQREAATLGFVSTGVRGDSLVNAVSSVLPRGTRFSIRDGDTVVGTTEPAPVDATTVQVEVAPGQSWEIVADDGKNANYSLAWLLGAATLLVTAAVAVVVWTRIDAQRKHAADARRHALSADLAQRLAGARSTAAVAEVVRTEAPALLGSTNATVRTLDDTKQVLQAVIDEGLPVGLAAQGAIPVNANSPPGRAVLERRWILVRDVPRDMQDYPELVGELMAANGFRALASIPLEDSSGTIVGLLGLAWDAPQRFDETTLALLRTVAELCEQTLERSRLHDSEHLLVQQLQLGALGTPPSVDHLDMAFRYESAVQTLTMGGDWYDAVVLDDHRCALVVGDVAGHGVPAIAEMIELRSAIHALLRSHHPLDHVLEVADAILMGSDRTRIATVMIASFDSKARSVQYVSAGHPPAVLRTPTGDVEVLIDGRRPVLGVEPVSPCVVAQRPFEVGSTFVAYTDGLVERRGEDLLVSIDRLASSIEPSTLDGEQLADQLLLAHAPARSGNDDIALVVVHATP